MASNSLGEWNHSRAKTLDEIASAHARVGGTAPGRRYATLQINYAYTMLLSSQFQGFCRDLHSESIDHLARCVSPFAMQTVLRAEFTLHRKLDRGNPSPASIGSDFNRLGLSFWDEVKAAGRRNLGRMASLEELNNWRNAIAHHDFDPGKTGSTIPLGLATVKKWREACNQLSNVFDEVLKKHLAQITGNQPW